MGTVFICVETSILIGVLVGGGLHSGYEDRWGVVFIRAMMTGARDSLRGVVFIWAMMTGGARFLAGGGLHSAYEDRWSAISCGGWSSFGL